MTNCELSMNVTQFIPFHYLVRLIFSDNFTANQPIRGLQLPVAISLMSSFDVAAGKMISSFFEIKIILSMNFWYINLHDFVDNQMI